MHPIISRNNLADTAQSWHRSGKKIVFTNGCFDILHIGHVRYLHHARTLGDLLIVGINSDHSVSRLKGPTRPINSEGDRAEMLAALASVDAVTIFPEDTPIETIELIKPTIHVKGGDYTVDSLPEAKIVHAYGGKVVILPFTDERSTSQIIQKIVDKHSS